MNIRDLKLLCVISLSVIILICIVVIVTFDINTWKFSATGASLGSLSCVNIINNWLSILIKLKISRILFETVGIDIY